MIEWIKCTGLAVMSFTMAAMLGIILYISIVFTPLYCTTGCIIISLFGITLLFKSSRT